MKNVKPLKIKGRTHVNAYSFGSMLFDLENDPGQENPIIDEQIERRMIELMVRLMQDNDAPLEQYERLGLPVDGLVQDDHLLLSAQAVLVEKSL
jgi:hypothetical protein